MKKDKALATAKALLVGSVCECGDLESEHLIPEPRACHRQDVPCACTAFKPVRFKVVRASEWKHYADKRKWERVW